MGMNEESIMDRFQSRVKNLPPMTDDEKALPALHDVLAV